MASDGMLSPHQEGVVYEVRALSNRWLEPMKGEVLSRHSSAKAAMDALAREPQAAADGTGRTSHGNYVAKAVVRLDAQANESVVLPPPIDGGGRIAWPYSN